MDWIFMSDGFQYGDLIFLGLIAAFVAFRLRAMLGRNEGIDPNEVWKNAARNVYQARVTQFAENLNKKTQDEETIPVDLRNNKAVADGLKAIRAADASFSTTEFLSGAKIAFEWVVDAFSKGNKDKLKTVLSDERFVHFAEEIDKRKNNETRDETTLVSILSADITEAEMKNAYAYITVQFTTEQIHVERDKNNNVVGGDPSHIEKIVDIWTFERSTSSRDPNWKIIAT